MTRAALIALFAVLLFGVPVAAAQQPAPDIVAVEAVIVDRANHYGVDGYLLVRVAWCESRMDPRAVGDNGQSLGLFQLHKRGLLRHFYAVGYSDPFDAFEASDYAAWAFSIGLAGHWSCARW